jgi:hypothetical protein
MSGLWPKHLITPRQEQLFRPHKKRAGLTQADLLIEMLRIKRAAGRALELPEIMAAGIAQHGARFHEIRKLGFIVLNESCRDGQVVRSRYRLTFDPACDTAPESDR